MKIKKEKLDVQILIQNIISFMDLKFMVMKYGYYQVVLRIVCPTESIFINQVIFLEGVPVGINANNCQ